MLIFGRRCVDDSSSRDRRLINEPASSDLDNQCNPCSNCHAHTVFSSMSTTLTLQQEWKQLMLQLPAAATARDPAQATWPVRLDHCFGRIILDAIVGIDRPWREKLPSPAIRHMSMEQLEACVALGREILSGKADLAELNQKSLVLRGKEKQGSFPGLRKGGAKGFKKEESSTRPSARQQYTQTTLCSFSKTTTLGRTGKASEGGTKTESG